MASQELTKCPVCLTQFGFGQYLPKISPVCGHTVCKLCLTQILRMRTPKCPLDQIAFGQHFQSVDAFPTNSLITNLIEKKKRSPRFSAHPEQPNNLICIDDDDSLTSGGAKDHDFRSFPEVYKNKEIKEHQFQTILNKIKANAENFQISIEEKGKRIRQTIKKRFRAFCEAIKQQLDQTLFHLENALREEKARAKNSRLDARAFEISCKLQEFSEMMSIPEVAKTIEEDFKELEQLATDEFIISSQKIKEFASLVTIFENSFPKEDLLKELNADLLEQNIAQWKKTRKSNIEGVQAVVIPSRVWLTFESDGFLRVVNWGNSAHKSNKDICYEKSELEKIQQVTYCDHFEQSMDENTMLPALLKLSEFLPNTKAFSFYLAPQGYRLESYSHEGLHNMLLTTLSQPEKIEKLDFFFEGYLSGDLGFPFLAENILPKIQNLKTFLVKVRGTEVSDQALKALAQVNWKAWPNLKQLRIDIPEPSFKETDLLQFLNAVPNIKILSLGFGDTQLTDQALENFSTNILPSLDKLEKLEIGLWKTKLTGVGVETLLMNLPNVKSLFIGIDHTGITEDGIKLFLEKKLPSLTKLGQLQFSVSKQNLSESTILQIRRWKEEINKGNEEFEARDDDDNDITCKPYNPAWMY